MEKAEKRYCFNYNNFCSVIVFQYLYVLQDVFIVFSIGKHICRIGNLLDAFPCELPLSLSLNFSLYLCLSYLCIFVFAL